MKIKAIRNVQIAGYGVVRRGKVIDFAKDKIDERMAANFVSAADDSRLKVTVKKKEGEQQPNLIEKTKEELLAEQDAKRKEARADILKKLGVGGIKEQLAEFGIPFTAETPDEKLADLYLDRIGE